MSECNTTSDYIAPGARPNLQKLCGARSLLWKWKILAQFVSLDGTFDVVCHNCGYSYFSGGVRFLAHPVVMQRLRSRQDSAVDRRRQIARLDVRSPLSLTNAVISGRSKVLQTNKQTNKQQNNNKQQTTNNKSLTNQQWPGLLETQSHSSKNTSASSAFSKILSGQSDINSISNKSLVPRS